MFIHTLDGRRKRNIDEVENIGSSETRKKSKYGDEALEKKIQVYERLAQCYHGKTYFPLIKEIFDSYTFTLLQYSEMLQILQCDKNGYADFIVELGKIFGDVDWPSKDEIQLNLEKSFQDRIIDTADHDVVKRTRGTVI